MDFESIRVTTDGPLGRLVLSRPERLNAIGATMLRELADAARWFDRQTEVRAVIVSGAGRAFSAGADLRDRPTAAADPASGNAWGVRREVGQLGLRMADAIEQMRAVTIAQVHGHVVGGGLVLMAACDLRVAATDTAFSIPEVELGIPLAWGGIPRLVREIGPALTKELVITCRPFTAAEAKAFGLVNRVVPAERLAAEAEVLAAEVIARPPVPVVITKEHVNAVTRSIAGSTAFADGDVLLGVAADPDSRAAALAYVERIFARHREPA
jgi:enoyl-CoA hydratase/carnithine racemase